MSEVFLVFPLHIVFNMYELLHSPMCYQTSLSFMPHLRGRPSAERSSAIRERVEVEISKELHLDLAAKRDLNSRREVQKLTR